MTKEQLLVLKKALREFGANEQLNMVIEECAELIQAINKVRRANLVWPYCIQKPSQETPVKTSLKYYGLCSEIADVKIMIAQIELIMDNDQAIQLAMDRKIDRLEERLKNK